MTRAARIRSASGGSTTMINISSRSRLIAATSPMALAMTLLGSGTAWAQDGQPSTAVTATAATSAAQPVPPPSDTAANAQSSDQPATADQGIVVTGFRASLRSSTAKKKN